MLTEKKLRSLLREDPPAKRVKYADAEGLFLSHSPSGALLWRFKFRFQGKEREMALGHFDGSAHCVFLAQARALHQNAKAQAPGWYRSHSS